MNTYRAVREMILTKIKDEVYLPGQQLDSFRKIAVSADTTVVTVLRALTSLVADGHLQHLPGNGYFVSRPDTKIAVQRKTIGFSYNNTTDLESDNCELRVALSVLTPALLKQSRSLYILAGITSNSVKGQFMDPAHIAEQQFEGLFFTQIFNAHYISEINRVQRNLVLLDMNASDLGIDCVSFDNVGSASALVHRLVARGAKRIAYVGGPITMGRSWLEQRLYDPSGRQRYEGWKIGMQSCSLAPDPQLAFINDNRWKIQDLMKRLLSASVLPDAILTEFVPLVLKALEEKGIPPGQIPVAGWTSQKPTQALQSRELLAECDFMELCTQGLQIMLRRIMDQNSPIEHHLITPVIHDGANPVPVACP